MLPPPLGSRWKQLCHRHVVAQLSLWQLFEEPGRRALHHNRHGAAVLVDVGQSPPPAPDACGLSGAAVTAVLGRFRGISSLELPVCTRLTAADVVRMAHVTSSLTSLGLSATNCCDCNCNRLRIDGAVVAALVSSCPALEEVELSGPTDAVLEALAAHCPRLRMADLNEVLSGSSASAEASMLAFVAACPKLRDFRPPADPREGFVTKLLSDNPGFPPARLAGLSHDYVVSDAILATVAESHPGLQCLDFAYPDSAAGFDTITQGFRCLTSLSLVWLEHPVPADFLRKLVRACPDLRRLDLGRTVGVTDIALCELRCPNLEDLCVIGTNDFGIISTLFLRRLLQLPLLPLWRIV